MKKIFSLMLVLLLSLTAVFAAGPLKIMSYNVRNAKGMDNAVDFGRVAKVILEAAPDVVAVQELDSMTVRYGKKYVLGEIASIVDMHPTYFPAIEFGGGKYGIGILSKEKPLSFAPLLNTSPASPRLKFNLSIPIDFPALDIS